MTRRVDELTEQLAEALLTDGDDDEQGTGVFCSRCLHDRGCPHTSHLVKALREGTVR